MPPILAAFFLAVSAGPAAGAAPRAADPSAIDTLVVCPTAFEAAMQPWFDLRRSEGRHIAVLSNLASPEEIRRQIRRLEIGGRLRFVLLVGGANAAMYTDPAVRARSVPMHYAKARVNVKWGSTSTIPTDNWYVQSDEAGDENPVPDAAIGRIPAESPQELAAIVKKIVAYEQSNDFGPWRERANFVAGMGDFGFLADTLLESAAQSLLTQIIPPEYHVSMTYANWRSPYCPDPRRFHRAVLDRLDEGALLWVYIGHSGVDETARMESPGGEYPILTTRDAARLVGGSERPIAIFLGCYAGAVDARVRCLASAMVASPGGPVAVIAGTRVTMPYAMTVMAANLTDECFRSPCETLGEALLHAKREMLRAPDKADARRAMLDSIAAVVSPSGNQLAAERAEHVLMFQLIGDPLLRLRHPRPVPLQTAKTASAGGRIVIQGTSPIEGRATVELLLRRDHLRGPRPARNAYPDSNAQLAAFDEVYRRANDHCLQTVAIPLHAGPFRTELDVPADAAGPCHVCIFIRGRADMAAGSAAVEVAAARKGQVSAGLSASRRLIVQSPYGYNIGITTLGKPTGKGM